MPLKSNMICSPAEVKFHRQVALKDCNGSEDTTKCLEELCKQFPDVFSTNNDDIGRSNVITMDIDTGDSLPFTKKPYTLPALQLSIARDQELAGSRHHHQKCVPMGKSYCSGSKAVGST